MDGYGIKYQFEFDATCKPFANQALYIVKCKVLILKKAYNATIYDIPYGQVSPVEIDYPTADDDIFYPLKGSSLTFKVLGGVINMDSIISEDELEYFIEYYRGNVLFWSGFVSPELCDEDIFLHYPAIEFKTIDGLGTLKNKLLKVNNKYPDGRLRLLDVLQNALKSIGYNYPLNVLIKTWYDTHVKTDYSTPLEQTYVYTAALRDNNFQFRSNVDLVLDICNVFNAFVYQNYGEWHIVKPKDLAFGINQQSKFSTSGVLNTSSKKTIKVMQHGTDFLIVAEPKRKIRRYYKEVEVEYLYATNKYFNGDWSTWEGTATPITKTNTLSFNSATYTETVFTGVDKSFLGTPKTYLIYDALADNYALGLTSALTSGCINGPIIYSNWGEGFNLSILCETNNPSFSVFVSFTHNNTNYTYYYNFTTGLWQTYEYIYTKAVNYSSVDINLFTQSFQFPAVMEGYELYNYTSYAVQIKLYAQSRVGYSGYETWYNQLLLNSAKPAKKTDKEITKIENIKNASIIPPKKSVYSGDGYVKDIISTEQDLSNFHVYVNNVFASTIQPYQILSPPYPPAYGWYEREEEDRYGINELNARNILNQYSDYRNIFTGTLIGKDLQFGAIYEFPNQGVLGSRKFFPLSMKINERDCTADVVLMEVSSNEITGQMTITRFDEKGLLISTNVSTSKKKLRDGVGTDLGQAGDFGTLFDRFVAFFMDDFKP